MDGAGEDRSARALHGHARLPGIRRPRAPAAHPHADADHRRRRRSGDSARALRGARARDWRSAPRGTLRGGAPGAPRAGRAVQPAGGELRGDARVSIWNKTAVVGAWEHPTRFAPPMTPFQIHPESARGALAGPGLTIRDADGLFTTVVRP